jgi:predicted esterase
VGCGLAWACGQPGAVPRSEAIHDHAVPVAAPPSPEVDASDDERTTRRPRASATPPPSAEAPALDRVATDPPGSAAPSAAATLDRVAVPGDRAVRVVHGAPRPIIYLHGVCGDIEAVLHFAGALRRHGTLLALYGDDACKDQPGRYRWESSVARLTERIDRAVEAVRANGTSLDPGARVIFGYSQGATRALGLHREHPDRYPWLVMGGAPVAPRVDAVGHSRGVLVFSGALEGNLPLEQAVSVLSEAHLRARYFELPGMQHGQYGRDAARLLDAGFAWLLEPPAR